MSVYETEGHAAYLEGKCLADNPYSMETREEIIARMKWAKGYWDERTAHIDRRVQAFNRTYTENATRRGQYED